jgi:putative transposase
MEAHPVRCHSFAPNLGAAIVDIPKRISKPQALRGKCALPKDVGISRQKHRESNVWQRRFWENTIQDEADWIWHLHLNYLHYNPMKHGLVGCPHQWEYSSFHQYVREGYYTENWGWQCEGRIAEGVLVDDSLQVGE